MIKSYNIVLLTPLPNVANIVNYKRIIYSIKTKKRIIAQVLGRYHWILAVNFRREGVRSEHATSNNTSSTFGAKVMVSPYN